MLSENTYRSLVASFAGGDLIGEIQKDLVPLWCDEYYLHNPGADVVQVDLNESASAFSYLFDIQLERVLAAFGIPIYAKHKRDANRMAGHPLANAGKFHRGHLMAHSIGGGTDINLVPQLGSLNIGAFRVLERMVRDQAKQSLRSFYFVRPIYTTQSQMPGRFEQCVILPNKTLLYSLHNNA